MLTPALTVILRLQPSNANPSTIAALIERIAQRAYYLAFGDCSVTLSDDGTAVQVAFGPSTITDHPEPATQLPPDGVRDVLSATGDIQFLGSGADSPAIGTVIDGDADATADTSATPAAGWLLLASSNDVLAARDITYGDYPYANVLITFDAAAGERLLSYTASHIGTNLVVAIDGVVVQTLPILEPSGAETYLQSVPTGLATALGVLLRSGPLPLPVTLEAATS